MIPKSWVTCKLCNGLGQFFARGTRYWCHRCLGLGYLDDGTGVPVEDNPCIELGYN